MDIHLPYVLRSVIVQLQTSSHQLEFEVGRYARIRLEEIFCQFCHQGVESEEHDVYHCTGFYETRGTYQCLFMQGFGPLHRVMEYKDQHCLEHFLLELNETWRKVVERQKYSQKNLIDKEPPQPSLTPSTPPMLKANQGYICRSLTITYERAHNRSCNSNLSCM